MRHMGQVLFLASHCRVDRISGPAFQAGGCVEASFCSMISYWACVHSQPHSWSCATAESPDLPTQVQRCTGEFITDSLSLTYVLHTNSVKQTLPVHNIASVEFFQSSNPAPKLQVQQQKIVIQERESFSMRL